MNNISVAELYEFYLDTIQKCSINLLARTDEEIEYELFDEFDVGAHSFLHDDNLAKLRFTGYLDDETMKISKQVRSQWLTLRQKTWTVEEIRTKKEWWDLFNLCDRLKSKLHQ